MSIRRGQAWPDVPEPPAAGIHAGFLFTGAGALPLPLEPTDYQVAPNEAYPTSYTGQDSDVVAGRWNPPGCANVTFSHLIWNVGSQKLQGVHNVTLVNDLCMAWKIELPAGFYDVWTVHGSPDFTSALGLTVLDGITLGNQTTRYSFAPTATGGPNTFRTILNDANLTAAQIDAQWESSSTLIEVTNRGPGNTGIDFRISSGLGEWCEFNHIRVRSL